MTVVLSPSLTFGNPPIALAPAATAGIVDPAFDERWAAWRARGLHHDGVVQRRLRVIAAIIAIVVAGGPLIGVIARGSL